MRDNERVHSLPRDASDANILALVDDWVELLAEERYGEALELVAARSYWTVDLLRAVIQGYGIPEPHPSGRSFRVTSPRTATTGANSPSAPARTVNRWEEPNDVNCIGAVQYDLPIDGHWSDLTALFEIVQDGDWLALELDDVHVL